LSIDDLNADGSLSLSFDEFTAVLVAQVVAAGGVERFD
jgi:hypothetical protein